MDKSEPNFRYLLTNPMISETVDVELTAHLDFFIIGALPVFLNNTSTLLLSELPAISLVCFVASRVFLSVDVDSTFGLVDGPSVFESRGGSLSPINTG